MECYQQKMRNALEAIKCINTEGLKRLLCELVEADIFDGGLINKTISAVEKARSALAAPPRNCDVGTADEQTKRFSAFCAEHRHTDLPRCFGCPLENTPSDTGCSFAWAQMPYEEEEGGAR